MFTVKIASSGSCYEYMCPYCGEINRWIGIFICQECHELLELYVGVLDTDVEERFAWHLEGANSVL